MNSESIRVLLIEDNPGDARLIQELLASVNMTRFDLERTDRLSTGLERLIAGDVDIVLLDLSLPDSQGLETLTRLKAQLPGTPIIVLTGLDDEALAIKAAQAGAQDYLVKGQVGGSLLARAMQYAIGRQRAEELLLQEKRKLEDVTRYANCGLFLLDSQARISYANSLAQEWFGPLDQLIGRHCCDVFAIADEDCSALKVLQSGETDYATLFTWTRAGEEKYFQVISSPVKDGAGRIRQVSQVLIDITERKRSEMALEQRTRELSVLYRIDQTISQSLDLDEILDVSLDKVLEAMDAEAGAIYLSQADDTLRLHIARGLSDEFVRSFSLIKRVGWDYFQVAIEQNLVRVDIAEHLSEDVALLVAKEGLQSTAIVPLVAKERVLGLLGLASHRPHIFSQDQVHFLASIGQQLGNAMDNAQLYEQSQEQARDLALLHDVEQLLAATLDEETIFREITRRCVEVFKVDSCLLRLVEDTAIVVKEAFFRDAQDRETVMSLLEELPLHVGEGIAGRVAQTGEVAVSGDEPVETLTLTPFAQYLRNRNWLVVPIKAKSQVIGMLTLITGKLGRRFTERDCSLAQAVANQTAVAIENARLFGETRDARDGVLNMLEDLEETAGELRLKSERLAVLNELDRVISSSFKLEEMYQSFVELAARLVSFDRTSISLLDAAGENWNIVSLWSRGEVDFPTGAQSPVKGSVMEVLLAERRPWWENDLGERGEFLENEFLRRQNVRSRILLPLIVRNRVVGALNFGSNQPGVYSERNLEVLVPLADQMAIAVENARLYAAQQRRAARLKVIGEVGRQIASILDQEELLHRVVAALIEGFDYYYAHILLGDASAGEIVLRASAGRIGRKLEGHSLKIGQEGIIGWVAESGKALLVNDVTREPRYKFVEELKDTRSELAVPILIKGQIVGVLDVQSAELNAFDEEDIFTLQALAEQTAVALDNARLYEMERKARQVAEVLYESTATLTGSLDLNLVLDRILDEVQRVIPHDAANIALVDGDFGRFARWRGYERFGMGAGAPGPDFRITDTPYYCFMAETNQPKITSDTYADPEWVRYPGMKWLSSYMGVPIRVREKLIGFLNLDSATPGFFDLAQTRLLQTFAHQVGAAIENARLYQEVLASEQEYRTLVENATEFIWTLDTEGYYTFVNRVALEAGGIKAEDLLGKHYAPLIVPEDLPQVQRVHAEALAGKKVSYETRVLHPDGHMMYLSVNIAPLRDGNKIVGVISFGRDVTAQKQAEAALQRRMTELTALFDVSTALRGAETLEAMLPIILNRIVAAVQADAGALFRRDENTNELIAEAVQGRLDALAGIRLAPSEGVCGYVAQTRTPYPFSDLASDPHMDGRVQSLVHGVQGGICVPLLIGEQLLGTMIVGSAGPRVFSNDEVRLLTAISDMAAAAIRRTVLFEELQHRVQELSTLFDVGSAVTSSLHVEDVVNLVVQASSRTLQAEGCILFLWDEQEQFLVMRAVIGAAPDLIGRIKYRSGEGLVGHVFLERRPVNVPDVAADPRWKREPEQENTLPSKRIANVVIVPLVVGQKVLGTLGVANKIGAPAFTAEDQSLLMTFASQVSVAIENARLYEDVRQFSIATIRSLTAAIDARDPYTRGHSEGVTRLAVQLAQQLGWSGADLETIEFAALLHDAGKIAVPDTILRKTDRLTPEDWNIIRLHPYFSARIVEPVGALRRVVPWVYHHHERWDGNGYPDGLREEKIPLGARIITVADAYNAMTTDRPYRKALSKTKAINEIKRCSGSQFDPKIVKIFLGMMSVKRRPS